MFVSSQRFWIFPELPICAPPPVNASCTLTAATVLSPVLVCFVQDAFTGGGAQIGNSGNIQNRWELTNMTTYTRGTQVLRWGGRVRQSFYNDTSVNNFGGAYTFFGGTGPQLDANNQPIPVPQVDLTALERYRRTLLFGQMGLSA